MQLARPTAGWMLWPAGWAGAIVAAWAVQTDPTTSELVQFLIQFALAAAAITLPALVTLNLSNRRPLRVTLRWQIVLLLLLAGWLAWAPWTDPAVGCLECVP